MINEDNKEDEVDDDEINRLNDKILRVSDRV